jgi:hypothetical protein
VRAPSPPAAHRRVRATLHADPRVLTPRAFARAGAARLAPGPAGGPRPPRHPPPAGRRHGRRRRTAGVGAWWGCGAGGAGAGRGVGAWGLRGGAPGRSGPGGRRRLRREGWRGGGGGGPCVAGGSLAALGRVGPPCARLWRVLRRSRARRAGAAGCGVRGGLGFRVTEAEPYGHPVTEDSVKARAASAQARPPSRPSRSDSDSDSDAGARLNPPAISDGRHAAAGRAVAAASATQWHCRPAYPTPQACTLLVIATARPGCPVAARRSGSRGTAVVCLAVTRALRLGDWRNRGCARGERACRPAWLCGPAS